MKGMARFLWPLGIFLGLSLLLFVGLGMDPRKVPSPLIDKPAPEFSLPRLENPEQTFSTADLRGQVSLVNVWATWCPTCRGEHDVLMRLAATEQVPIYGINYKDSRPNAMAWLRQLGNPYVTNGFDQDGRAGIDWGVYGTPETFVVDAQGVIRYKHIGALSDRDVRETLLPIIHGLQEEG